MQRLILELSLKPFRDSSDDGIRAICREIFRQWQPLIHGAERLSFLLWTADGSEILDYDGHREGELEWAKWIGIANGPWKEEPKIPHTWRWPYCEHVPRLTYERLEFIVRALKEEGQKLAGKPITVGTIFDPGPEFAESSFKYQRHPEIASGDIMGKNQWVNCGAVLHADDRLYAGFPQGIPEGTTLGTFLGRQSQHFLTDLGFDYLWFSNGFGFALAAWNVTGEVFDGTSFDVQGSARVRAAILRFWHDFRAECPHFPIETRGSNLSTGMDLSAHASPVREIYRGGFGMTAPVNSPWACMNGDYGLELIGWLSHIAELPDNGVVPFRFYIHDPWWLNSPWLDRHGREPNDIYLPLAVTRIAADGSVTRPGSVALLTIDDSYGEMPDVVPNEITPHLQRALADAPDAPGLITWIYPFDEYHEWTFGSSRRVDEVFFGDWFMRAAVNQGFPLNTVVSTTNFLQAKRSRPALCDDTILVCPAPDAGSELARMLIEHVEGGGQVLLYGPLRHADQRLRGLLNLETGQPVSGEMRIRSSLEPDALARGEFPDKFLLRPLLSAGGAEELLPTRSVPGHELLAEVEGRGGTRAFAVLRTLDGGGRVGWVRGAFGEEVSREHGLPRRDDPRQWFTTERLMRSILAKFGYLIRFHKPFVEAADPLILAARRRNAWFFSGFTPSTSVGLQWRFPDGVPVPVGCDVLVRDSLGTMILGRAWHRECRVFVRQAEHGEVSCRETLPGAVGVTRRLTVTGLRDATVTFLHDTSAPGAAVRFQEVEPYLGLGKDIPGQRTAADRTVAPGVTGSLLISW